QNLNNMIVEDRLALRFVDFGNIWGPIPSSDVPLRNKVKKGLILAAIKILTGQHIRDSAILSGGSLESAIDSDTFMELITSRFGNGQEDLGLQLYRVFEQAWADDNVTLEHLIERLHGLLRRQGI